MSEQQETPRVHPQDPSEGPDENAPANTPRVHPEDPAEGADDPAVTEDSRDGAAGGSPTGHS